MGSQAGLQVKRHRCIPMFLPQKPCLVLHFDFLLHLLQTRRQITSECTLCSSDTKLRETNVPSPVPPRRCPLAVGVRRTLGGTTELRELDVALRLPEGKARSPQASPRAEGGGGLGTLGTLIPFLKGSRGDPLRLPRGRSRPTPPKSLQPPPPPPPLRGFPWGSA